MMTNKLPYPSDIEEKSPLRLMWPGWSDLGQLLPQLPSQPAVYVFEDEKKKPLYIGKTIHPVTRIRQHVKTALEKAALREHFVFFTKHLKVIPVNSELEAILLEAKLIRMHQPKYNIIQKDDKSELYIIISKDEFPEVRVVRGSDLPDNVFMAGPFMSARQVQQIFKLGRRIFKFCAKPPNAGIKRACFYYHLSLCSGACVGKVSAISYRKKIGLLKKFLNGQTKLLLRQLRTEITKAAKLRKFEVALEIKQMYLAIYQATYVSHGISAYLTAPVENKLRALSEVLKKEGVNVSLERIETYDIATLMQEDTVGSMIVFFMGAPQTDQYRKFKMIRTDGGDPAAMAEMLQRRFRHPEWETPSLVVLDGGIPQLSVAGELIPSEIPRIGLAKKEETIIIPKNNGYVWVNLPRSSPALKLLQQMRDEAHRFATTYHKKVRDKKRIS